MLVTDGRRGFDYSGRFFLGAGNCRGCEKRFFASEVRVVCERETEVGPFKKGVFFARDFRVEAEELRGYQK